MSTSGPTLLTLIGDVKAFFMGGFQNMPLAITGTLLIVSLMTANYSMLFMAIGILIIVPVTPVNGVNDVIDGGKQTGGATVVVFWLFVVPVPPLAICCS